MDRSAASATPQSFARVQLQWVFHLDYGRWRYSMPHTFPCDGWAVRDWRAVPLMIPVNYAYVDRRPGTSTQCRSVPRITYSEGME
jgi:hypothetical protein